MLSLFKQPSTLSRHWITSTCKHKIDAGYPPTTNNANPFSSLTSLQRFLVLTPAHTMSSAAPSRRFHYFTKLPAELRLKIWLLCLPRRTSDNWPEGFWSEGYNLRFRNQDGPDDHYYAGRRMAPPKIKVDHICTCELKLSFVLNSNRPVISAVCREARDLVLRYGALEDHEQKPGFGHLWGRWYMWRLPNLSRAAYYTWNLYNIFHYPDEVVDWSDPEQVAITDLWRQVFERIQEQGLTFCTDWSVVSPFSDRGGIQQTVKVTLTTHFVRLARGLVVPLVVRHVPIHITRQQAATTDLFGRLAEEVYQDVDVDDADGLAAYYALWDAFTADKHKKRVARRELWNKILPQHKYNYATQVAEELQQWQYQMLLAAWYDERSHLDDPQARDALDGAFPSSCDLLARDVHENGFPRRTEHPPDYWHPWVIKTTAALPTLKPVIRFRLCPDPMCLVERGRSRFTFKKLSGTDKLKRSLRARQYFRFRGRGRWRWRSWAKGVWKARRGKAPGLPYRRRWLKPDGIPVEMWKMLHNRDRDDAESVSSWRWSMSSYSIHPFPVDPPRQVFYRFSLL